MSKKEWGNATWYLFHTLAEKIDEQYFLENKAEFFNIITIICRNLPCPECAEDSSTILKKANLNNLNSKENLKEFFFEFHNKVNTNLKKQIFNKDNLIKYQSAVPLNIMKHFIQKYFTRGYNEKMLMHSFSASKIETQIKKYLMDLYNNGNITH